MWIKRQLTSSWLDLELQSAQNLIKISGYTTVEKIQIIKWCYNGSLSKEICTLLHYIPILTFDSYLLI